jgi:hypothetical protein
MFFEWDFVSLISRSVKTDECEKVMPLDEEMITDLLRWSSETPYADDQDWIFASGRMKGRQPLWPEAIERNPTGSGTGQNHQAHQLARIPPHIFYASR